MATKAVAAVPDLAPTPATSQMSAEDLAIPRLYVANQLSQAVKSRLVEFGDLYLALDADDPEPQVLWSLGSDAPGVRFHVLDLFKRKSVQVEGGGLENYDYDDPNAPFDAATTYNYTLFLPDVDRDMPARMLLTRSGRPTAQRINTVLMRHASSGPHFECAFRMTTTRRSKDRHEWAIAQVTTAEALKDDVTRAGQLAAAVASQPQTRTSDEPEI